MAALGDALGFEVVGLFFFVGQDVHAIFTIVGYDRGTMFVVGHIGLLAMKGAVYVVVAAVGAGRVSGCVRVPAPCVGWGGAARCDGAARCGLSGGGGGL